MTTKSIQHDVPGWITAGTRPADYTMGVDPSVVLAGKPSGILTCVTPDPRGFGTYMQMFDAGEYRGKRVRFSAQVKAEEVAPWAGLWMRVDAETKDGIAFDNMQDRAIKGTQDWTWHAVVLNVAAEASAIAFGILLDGKGTVWINDVRFETVSDDVPVTGMQKQLPSGPCNLGFDETH